MKKSYLYISLLCILSAALAVGVTIHKTNLANNTTAGTPSSMQAEVSPDTVSSQHLGSAPTTPSAPSRAELAPDTPTEAKMRAAGLVDIAEADSAIAVHLVYATPYNFMGRVLYHDINKAFMLPALAEKVVAARRLLKSIRPDLNLLIYDAARPISVQHQMWDMVAGTPMSDFVANPNRGNGLHNYGAAVDVTLMDCTGNPLPMGSEYDYFGDEARTDNEERLLEDGRITIRELENRRLLRRVMTESGLRTITSEWWHFNLVTAAEARKSLKTI